MTTFICVSLPAAWAIWSVVGRQLEMPWGRALGFGALIGVAMPVTVSLTVALLLEGIL